MIKQLLKERDFNTISSSSVSLEVVPTYQSKGKKLSNEFYDGSKFFYPITKSKHAKKKKRKPWALILYLLLLLPFYYQNFNQMKDYHRRQWKNHHARQKPKDTQENRMFNRARQSHNVVNQDPKRSNTKPRRQTTVARDIRWWPRVNRS